MAKIRKYALTALAIVAFLTLMFLLYKGTQRNEATLEERRRPAYPQVPRRHQAPRYRPRRFLSRAHRRHPRRNSRSSRRERRIRPRNLLRPPQRIRPNRRRALHLTLGRNNIKPMQQAPPPVPVGLPAHPRGKNPHARRTYPTSRWQMERLTAHSTIPRYV